MLGGKKSELIHDSPGSLLCFRIHPDESYFLSFCLLDFFFFFFTFGKFEYQHCLIFSAHLVDFHFLLRLFGLLLVVNMFKAMSGSCSPFPEKQLFYSESPVMHCSYLLCSLCLNKQNKIHQSSTVVSLRVCGLVSILAFLP